MSSNEESGKLFHVEEIHLKLYWERRFLVQSSPTLICHPTRTRRCLWRHLFWVWESYFQSIVITNNREIIPCPQIFYDPIIKQETTSENRWMQRKKYAIKLSILSNGFLHSSCFTHTTCIFLFSSPLFLSSLLPKHTASVMKYFHEFSIPNARRKNH